MKLKKVKVGIVGLGLVSTSHIKAYQSHPDAEVVAVCDLDEAQRNMTADAYGIAKRYASYEEMFKDPDINTVDIATPTFLHAPMAIAAARAGKNILCEKPFCLTLAEGREVCEEANGNGVALMVGESYLFMTSIKKARELIDAGEIGKPLQIRERFGAWNERPGVLEARKVTIDRAWRKDSSKAGGAGFPWMFDHCVHFFATAEYLMNDSRIKEVNSIMSDNSGLSGERARKEGNGEATRNGADASLDIPLMTWTYDDPACQGVWMRAEPLNGKYDPMTGFSVSVIGEKGMIEVLGEGGGGLQWRGKDVHLVLHRKDGETLALRFDEGGDDVWESEVSYYGRAHGNQIHEFVDCLIQGEAPRYRGVDGARAVQTTIAAICSAKEGAPVKVSEATDVRANK